MRVVADLHIHSPYARAVSKAMTLENLDLWARIKGINVMGTGDFTHPKWIKEIKSKLEPAEEGLYKLKSQISNLKPQTNSKLKITNSQTRFMLTVEISSIYSKGGKVRRVHNLVFAPSIESAEKINSKLSWIGNIKSDGRPILGLDSKELLKIVLDVDENCFFVPAHCLLPFEYLHTERGVKKIQDVHSGEYVYTHKGHLKKVEEVYTRPYKGKSYHVKPWYFGLGLTTTSEHPFFAIKTQKHCDWCHGFCRPGCSGKSHCCKKHQAKAENFKPAWIRAENLEKSDVLVFPRFTQTKDIYSFVLSDYIATLPKQILFSSPTLTNDSRTITMAGTRSRVLVDKVGVTKDFCRLAGYFVAEGSVNGRDAISFTFAAHEIAYQNDVKDIMLNTFGLARAKERSKGGSTELIFYSKILQEVFSSLFYGRQSTHQAHTKALPSWMLALPADKQAEIFKAWWRGDTGYTVSRELMNQMKIIALRLGIIPSISQFSSAEFNKKRHNIEGRSITSRHGLFYFANLAFFEDKFGLRADPIFRKKRFMPKLSRRHGWMDESYIYIPIRDIEIKEYEGAVYNLEVEDDHSYLTEFAAVHNCWTPWFSVFGSKSGFDAVEECFDEYSKYIFALETGLSSDPAMNWRLSALDKYALISNSDSHSLRRIGREANIFEADLSYKGIIEAIKSKDPKRFLSTIEFFPEEGIYHYDGHRVCGVRLKPEETRKLNNLCPKCGKVVTIGVMNRVEEIADRPENFRPKNAIPYKNMVPLDEIIAEAFGVGSATSKRVQKEYFNLIDQFGSELKILFDLSRRELEKAVRPEIAEGIMRVREGKLSIEPGYDGLYGKVKIFDDKEREEISKQGDLFG